MSKSNKFIGIEWSSEVNKGNIVSYLMVTIVAATFLSGIAMLQPSILKMIGIDKSVHGLWTSKLGVIREVSFILLAGLYGVLSERLGRKAVYAFGLIIASIAYTLYPLGTEGYHLYMIILIFGIGGAAFLAMMVTVITDYASEKDRGKANGIQGFIMTLGGVIALIIAAMPNIFAKQGFTEAEAFRTTFFIVAGVGVLGAIIAMVGLKNVSGRKEADKTPFLTIAKEGLKAAKSDPGIALSYGAAFISRGDLAVTGQFTMLWLTMYASEIMGKPEAEATGMAGGVMGFVVIGAILGAILMGIVADRVKRVTSVSISSGLAFIIYVSVFTIDDPYTGYAKILFLIMGVAEISGFVSSQALAGQQVLPKDRGTVMGFFGVAGACGMVVGTAMGGPLYDKFGFSAPFVMFGIVNGIVFLWSILVRNKVVPAAVRHPELFNEVDGQPGSV